MNGMPPPIFRNSGINRPKRSKKMDNLNDRKQALAEFLNVKVEHIVNNEGHVYTFQGKNCVRAEAVSISPDQFPKEENAAEYLVMTEEEANTAASEKIKGDLSDYLDALEVPETVQWCVNEELWEQEYLIEHGRGGALSPYNGDEIEQKVNGVHYFIYRIK